MAVTVPPFIDPSVSNNNSTSVLGLTNSTATAATPQVNASLAQTSQQNNQAQQQLGNNAINNVFTAGSKLSNFSNNGWYANNITNPLNTWGNTALGFAPAASASSSIFGSAAATAGENSALLASTVNDAGSAELTSILSSGTEYEGASTLAPSWTGATFSGALGAAGLGYVGGGFLAGLEGGNVQGGQIGGAIGAGAGFAIGGPPGAIIGGILGSTIGGLFGNNQMSDSTQVGLIDNRVGQINPDGMNKASGTGSEYSKQNADIRNTAQQGAANLEQWLIANGATANDSGNNHQLVIKVGARDGYQVGTQNYQNGQLNFTDTLKSGSSPDKFYTAVSKNVLSQYNISDDLQRKMANVNSSVFYDPNFSVQNALQNPQSIQSNGGMNLTGNFNTPTPMINAANNQGRGLLQIPTNNPTGQVNAQS